MDHAAVPGQSVTTRLRPSSRLLRDVPAFQPWMLSCYGLALPMTSCDADLYATIYEQSKDGAGVFSESMTAFAATHGFSSHAVIAARRRLQAAGLIDYVLDDDGNRVSLTRPGKPVYLYRANLEAAFEAENRFRASMPENLAALRSAVGGAEADRPCLGTTPSPSIPAPSHEVSFPAAAECDEPAATREEDPSSASLAPSSREAASPDVCQEPGGAKLAAEAPSPAPIRAQRIPYADDLMWVFTSCYPKAQRGLDEVTAGKVKAALGELVSRLGATKEEVQEACLLRRREARANNPELFDGSATEAQKWKFLPSALDFVTRPQGLSAAIMSVRADARENEQQRFSASQSNNVATVVPAARARTSANTDPAGLCEAVLAESTYNRAAGFDDLWFATCPHGLNGGYQSWLMTARTKAEAVADHRRQVEGALGLSRPADPIGAYVEQKRALGAAEEARAETPEMPAGDEGDLSVPARAESRDEPAAEPVAPPQDAPEQAWKQVVGDIVASRPDLAAALEGSRVVGEVGACLQVALSENHSFYLNVLTRPRNSSDITAAVSALLGSREVRFLASAPAE